MAVPALKSRFQAQSSGLHSWLAVAYIGDWAIKTLSSKAYITNLRLRLLLPVLQPSLTGPCGCIPHGPRVHHVEASTHIQMDDPREVYHCLSCSSSNQLCIARHNALCSALVKIVESIGIRSEPNPSFSTPSQLDRVATPDVSVTINHIPFSIDLTVSESSCSSYHNRSIADVLIARETQKKALYANRIPLSNVFVPFALDSTGNLSPESTKFITTTLVGYLLSLSSEASVGNVPVTAKFLKSLPSKDKFLSRFRSQISVILADYAARLVDSYQLAHSG